MENVVERVVRSGEEDVEATVLVAANGDVARVGGEEGGGGPGAGGESCQVCSMTPLLR